MAVRYAVATGNWSSTATWNGGTLPTSADDVYANTFTVTIDTNITVLSLRTTSNTSPAVTAGGGFTLSNGFTVSATGVGVLSGTTVCLAYAGASNTTINAAITSSSATTNGHGMNITGAGTVTITGNVLTGGAPGANGVVSNNGSIVVNGDVWLTASNGIGISTSGSTATVTVNGRVKGGGTASTFAHGISTTGTDATVTVTGDVQAGTGGLGAAGVYTTGIRGYISVTGNVANLASPTWGAVRSDGTNANVTIVGSVSTGASAAGYGAYVVGAAANLSVTGAVTAGSTASSAHAIFTSGNSTTRTVSVIGTVTASVAASGVGAHGIYDTNNAGGWTVVGGSLVDSAQGDCAVSARRFRCIPTLNTVRQHANNTGYPSGGTITYGSLDYIPNNVPVPANVRSGILYGDNSFTGTCAVPAAASVAYGVPVDNTTGTAAVNLADIAAVTGAQIAAAVNLAP